MNEKSKLIIILISILIIVLGVIGFVVSENIKSEKIYKDFNEKFNGKENSLIYIGRPTCSWCNLLTPTMDEMKNRYNFSYTYLNIDEINKKYLNKILKDLNLNSVSTPYLAIVSNGKVVASQNGLDDYNIIFNLLQENNIINKNAKLLLNYINYDEYSNLIKDKNANIIVVGQKTCGYCINAKLVLNEIASKNNIKINYFSITGLNTEQKEGFNKSFEYFSGNWGTPVTLIVKDEKIVDMLEQLVTEEEYVKFFQKNGVL